MRMMIWRAKERSRKSSWFSLSSAFLVDGGVFAVAVFIRGIFEILDFGKKYEERKRNVC